MNAKVREITPDLAEKWLATSEGNRNLSPAIVARFAKDIAEDRWNVNGETIVMDDEGRLLDGQHRLAACVEAKKSFSTFVVHGVPRAAFATLDSGRKRMVADVLHIAGHTDTKTLSAALNVVLALNSSAPSTAYNYKAVTNSNALTVLEQHVGITESILFSSRLISANKVAFISRGNLAGLHYAFSQKSPAAADDFVETLCTGELLTRESPIFMLRKRLDEMTRNRGSQPRAYTVWAFTIQAWNAWRENRTIPRFRYDPALHNFPKIR